MAKCFLGMIGGDNRKQNCNEHVARSIPACVSAAILFMVRGRKLALAVPQDGLQEGSEEITVSIIAMNTSPGASLRVSRLQLCLWTEAKTSPGSAAGWIAGGFARWFVGWIAGGFGGNNRKQNCNEPAARSIPVWVSAAILSCGVDKDIVQDVPDSVFMA